jgi:hypothetical protein
VNTAPEKTGSPWLIYLFIFVSIFALLIGGALKGQGGPHGNPSSIATVSQVKTYAAALVVFRDMFKAMPGDMANAGAALTGCTSSNGSDCNPLSSSAGDDIIGNPDFAKTLKPQITKITVPAASAADETILFWRHLLLANLIGGMTADEMKSGSPIVIGLNIPEAKTGGGFIVGYSDGTPVPESLSPPSEGLKGTILVQISDEVLKGAAELKNLILLTNKPSHHSGRRKLIEGWMMADLSLVTCVVMAHLAALRVKVTVFTMRRTPNKIAA